MKALWRRWPKRRLSCWNVRPDELGRHECVAVRLAGQLEVELPITEHAR